MAYTFDKLFVLYLVLHLLTRYPLHKYLPLSVILHLLSKGRSLKDQVRIRTLGITEHSATPGNLSAVNIFLKQL